MTHTCFGEYCIISDSWNCANRAGRGEADARSQQEVRAARRPVELQIQEMGEEFDKRVHKMLEGKSMMAATYAEVAKISKEAMSIMTELANKFTQAESTTRYHTAAEVRVVYHDLVARMLKKELERHQQLAERYKKGEKTRVNEIVEGA